MRRVLEQQQRAIKSIPSYIRVCNNFWLCAPSGCVHRDTGLLCDHTSWKLRGWCRMEMCMLNLTQVCPLMTSDDL